MKSYLKSYYQNIFASKPEEKDALPSQLGCLSSTKANPEQGKDMDQQHGENKQTTKPQTNKHPKNDKKGPFCRPCNTKAQAKRAKRASSQHKQQFEGENFKSPFFEELASYSATDYKMLVIIIIKKKITL